jgi:hypothetical protein
MNRTWLVAWISVVGLAVASCDGGTAGAGTGTTGVSLRVASATGATTLDGVPAGSGNTYVTVELTLANSGAPVPLSTSPALFNLATVAAIDYAPSAEQGSDVCQATVSVATGGHVACSIAFELPTSSAATELVYDDKQGDQATTPVPQPGGSGSDAGMGSGSDAACVTLYGWIGAPSQACENCIIAAGSGSSTCGADGSAYTSGCGSATASTCEGSSDPCGCEQATDSAACQTKYETYTQCIVTACMSTCD